MAAKHINTTIIVLYLDLQNQHQFTHICVCQLC